MPRLRHQPDGTLLKVYRYIKAYKRYNLNRERDYVHVHSQFDWSVFPELRSNNGHVKPDEICKGHDILVYLAMSQNQLSVLEKKNLFSKIVVLKCNAI